MKKNYRKPVARKVDYTFQENVAAASYPIREYADPWHGGVCTWGDGSCSVMYHQARSLTDCMVDPGIPLPGETE